MVLLAAAICTRDGKPLLSRQFVEMTRSRIEGLLAAFPKLIGTAEYSDQLVPVDPAQNECKQHTFVETESVRYVYQPLEKLYILLITTKASNILEDLETLRLFARVIPEYSRGTDEADIVTDAYQIIFAFDEIVALGYRESVNIAQIRTFTEMDSHEEKVFQAARETQERDAKINMKRRARELEQARRDAAKRGGGKSGIGSAGGFGSSSGGGSGGGHMSMVSEIQPSEGDGGYRAPPPSTRAPASHSSGGPSRAMKLGGKSHDVDSFVDQLKAEGEVVVENRGGGVGGGVSTAGGGGSASVTHTAAADMDDVHVRVEEKLTVLAGRDGNLQTMELLGILQVRVNKPDLAHVKVKVNADRATGKGAQLQTHPNIDKQIFKNNGWIQAKSNGKPYPTGQEVGVLKWRLQTQDESMIPLTKCVPPSPYFFIVNCWPNVSGNTCDVNIEYELQDDDLELHDVVITIPLPSGSGAPTVSECEGEYHVTRGQLEWCMPLVDVDNKSGSMEFSIKNGHVDDFFPVMVAFVSEVSYCGIQIQELCNPAENNSPVKYSSEVAFFSDKYEIV